MRPLVSIITVTKNCVSTIERTLESIQAIKTPDIQYIVIDGKSVDGTLATIERYGNLVDILISEEDSGIYNAMNKGAEVAQGKYILFLNGDDHILADGFNQAKVILEKDAPEILSCRSEVVTQYGENASTIGPSLWRLYFFNSIPHLSTFVSAELQRKFKFREVFRIAADYDLFLRMYLKGHRFMLSEFVTSVHYRGGFSNNLKQVIIEIRQIRKDNLGSVLYFLTRGIEWLHKSKKAVF
ncbi:MAG: glycosyltransferase family 2 protein [Cellvibrio sp.]|uniref:glycosyltransferase family 2 protein n=1 Tax=Cellvibrio sp. TaxID=1965322 RepID=UPI0027235BA1|nr:glycosyltransferase family 2 protein [Cellvibrio sp.]